MRQRWPAASAGDVVEAVDGLDHGVEAAAAEHGALAAHGVGRRCRAAGRPWRSSGGPGRPTVRCRPRCGRDPASTSARRPTGASPWRPMMTTGRSLPSVGSSSNGTHVHTTSPGSGSPSMFGVYSMRTPDVDGARRRLASPARAPGVALRLLERRGDTPDGVAWDVQPSGHRVRVGRSPDVGGQEVVVRLAAHDEPGRAAGDEHDRRPRHLVVVRTHRVAVGAGDRARRAGRRRPGRRAAGRRTAGRRPTRSACRRPGPGGVRSASTSRGRNAS